LGGDFNVVHFSLERRGSDLFTSAMYDFSGFLSINGLIDIPLKGGSFACSNNREIASMSRIDRFLFTLEWEESFGSISQKRLDRLNSNHFPIMLECGSFH
jgi:hypothetical protein